MDLTLYNAVRPKMQTGDLILWSSNTILGKLIQWFSRAKENHASLVIRFTQYNRDRVYILEALEHGIVLRALSERLENHKGKAWWYPVIPELDSRRKSCGAIALAKVGTKYDYGSLFKQAVARVSIDAKRFFCSEYWQWCWQKAGVPFVSQIAMRPGDLPKKCTIIKPGVEL